MKKSQICCTAMLCATVIGFSIALPQAAFADIERITVPEIHNEYERISQQNHSKVFWSQGLRAIYPNTWQVTQKNNVVHFAAPGNKETIQAELLKITCLPETFQAIGTDYAKKAGGHNINLTDKELTFTTSDGMVQHVRPFGSKLVVFTFATANSHNNTHSTNSNYSTDFTSVLHSIAPQDYDLETTDLSVQCKDNVLKVKKLTFTYPTVTIAGQKAISKKISQTIAKKTTLAKSEYLKANGAKNLLTEKNTFVPTFHNSKYLSFLQNGYHYFTGAAHPISWKIGVTFDLITGEEVLWKDLVRPEDADSFTIDGITAKLLAVTKAKGIPLYKDFTKLKALPKDYYLDKNGMLHFIFGQYEIAPYAICLIDLNMEKIVKD